MELKKIDNCRDIYEDEAISAIFALAIFGATHGKMKSAAQSMYSKQQGLFFVALENDVPVGIIGLKQYDSDKLELIHLAVKEDARGRGLGLEMMKGVLDLTRIPLLEAEVDYKEMRYLKACGFSAKDMVDSGLERFKCSYRG